MSKAALRGAENYRFFADRAPEGWRADLHKALDAGLQNLGRLALSLESYPSLRDRQVLGRKERTYETLMRALLDGGEHGLEWVLPTKAVVARTYGIAKVQFLTSLRYVVDACEGDVVKRQAKKGRPFYACSRYPECTFMTREVPSNKPCPKCGSLLFSRRVKNRGQMLICLKESCGYRLELLDEENGKQPENGE